MTTPESTATAADRFPSLRATQAAHAELLAAVPDEELSPADAERVRAFLKRGAATGTVLDHPADRKTAQGLLDYWRATLYAASRDLGPEQAAGELASQRLADAVLAPFDAATVGSVARAAEEAYVGLLPADQELVRRLLLRLVRLASDRREIEPDPTPLGRLETLGDPTKVRERVDHLVRLGVLRAEVGPSGESYRLAYEALGRSWQRLHTWLDQRLRFRDTVLYWKDHNKHEAALIKGDLLDEARDYHDKNVLEEAFVRASEKRQTWCYRVTTAVLAGLALGAVVFAIITTVLWRRANNERDRANSERDRANEESKWADWGQDEAFAAMTEAVKNQRLAEQHRDTLDLKNQLTLLDLLTRYLAEVATAQTSSERNLAERRWSAFTRQLKADGKHSDLLSKLDLPRLLKDAQSREGENRLSGESLRAIRRLRDHGIQDETIRRTLEGLRGVAFEVVDHVTDRLEKLIPTRPYSEAEPYEREFWTLYWGQMVLVEGRAVEGRMVAFGRVLIDIHSELKQPDPEMQETLQKSTARLSKDKAAQLLDSAKELNTRSYEQFRKQFAELPTDLLGRLLQEAGQRRVRDPKLHERIREQRKALKEALAEECAEPIKPYAEAKTF